MNCGRCLLLAPKISSFFRVTDLTFLIFAEEDGQQVEAIKWEAAAVTGGKPVL